MIMYTIFINIIAWIAIIWFLIILLMHIGLFLRDFYTNDCKYIAVRRSTYFSCPIDDYWYILPQFSVGITKTYKEIQFKWLRCEFYICYTLLTEEQEDIECKARQKLRKK